MQSKNVLVRNMAFRGRIGKTKLVRTGGNARIFSEMQRGARASRGHFGTTIPNQLFKVEKNVRMNLLVFSKLKGNSRQRLKPMQVASQLGVNLSQLGVLRGYILPLFKQKDKRSLLSELFTSSRAYSTVKKELATSRGVNSLKMRYALSNANIFGIRLFLELTKDFYRASLFAPNTEGTPEMRAAPEPIV